jgi:hypothetical protein
VLTSEARRASVLKCTLERHSASENDVGVGRGLAGADHELRLRDHAFELLVGDEAEVRQAGRQDLV